MNPVTITCPYCGLTEIATDRFGAAQLVGVSNDPCGPSRVVDEGGQHICTRFEDKCNGCGKAHLVELRAEVVAYTAPMPDYQRSEKEDVSA